MYDMLAIFYCLRDICCFRNTVDADPRWCCTYLLGPSDALFIEVGRAFIKQQIKGIYLSFVSLQHMKLNFFPKFLNEITQVLRVDFWCMFPWDSPFSFWIYAEYGDVTNIYNWYSLLICFFGNFCWMYGVVALFPLHVGSQRFAVVLLVGIFCLSLLLKKNVYARTLWIRIREKKNIMDLGAGKF
jgi:hypothetical protein